MAAFSEKLQEQVLKTISNGKSVHRRVPGGLLHIDRPLPFLLVFRKDPEKKLDRQTALLLKSEAAYLTADRAKSEEISALVNKIACTLSDKFGSFLIIEIWNTDETKSEDPDFTIHGPQKSLPAACEIMKQSLEDIRMRHVSLIVEVADTASVHPPGLPKLLSSAQMKKAGCLTLGLGIKPFYWNKSENEVYPLLFRTVQKHLSHALHKSFFEFVRIQTTHQPTHFQALGQQMISRMIFRIDDELTKISNSYSFLMLVTPTNNKEAWKEFKKNKFQKIPRFHYRFMPVDPDGLKRQLHNIPIEKVLDPTLGYLFRDKRKEIDRMLSMLADRDTRGFLYGSLNVYGGVQENLLHIAEGILSAIQKDEEDEVEYISPRDFAGRAQDELDYFKQQYDEVESKVEIRNDVVGLMVSQGILCIGSDAGVSKARCEALIQHEVGTHVLTWINGKAQPLQLMYSGVPGYEELQEGLAVLSEYLAGGLTASRMRTLAGRVVAVDSLVNGATFIDTFRLLKDHYGFSDWMSWYITMRVYRGGGLTKDAVYLRGLVHLLDHLKAGNPLEPLLIGKIRQDYLPLVNELIHREILVPPPLKPRYLTDPGMLKRLDEIKKGVTVFNLLQQK